MTRLTRLAMVTSIERKPTAPCCAEPKYAIDSANTVNTSATASTQRLRMRSQNSLPAMVATCENSMIRLSVREPEEHVFERRLAHREVAHLAIEGGQGGDHRHLGVARTLHRDAA